MVCRSFPGNVNHCVPPTASNVAHRMNLHPFGVVRVLCVRPGTPGNGCRPATERHAALCRYLRTQTYREQGTTRRRGLSTLISWGLLAKLQGGEGQMILPRSQFLKRNRDPFTFFFSLEVSNKNARFPCSFSSWRPGGFTIIPAECAQNEWNCCRSICGPCAFCRSR
jgi:hypothetical protein